MVLSHTRSRVSESASYQFRMDCLHHQHSTANSLAISAKSLLGKALQLPYVMAWQGNAEILG